MRQRKGFTLIELLVVIAIIAILAVTIVMAVSNARTKAADAKVKNDLNELYRAYKVHISLHDDLNPFGNIDPPRKIQVNDVKKMLDGDNNSIMQIAPSHPDKNKDYIIQAIRFNMPNLLVIAFQGDLSTPGKYYRCEYSQDFDNNTISSDGCREW